MSQTNHTRRGIGVAAFGLLFAVGGGPARAAEPEPAYTLTAEKGGFISSAQFSPDGKTLFTLGEKPLIGVRDAATGKLTRTVDLPGVKFVADLSPDGTRAVTYGDNAVLVWDVATGKQVAEVKGGPNESLAIRGVSPDGGRVLTVSGKTTAKVWDVKTGKVLATFTGHKGEIASGAFDADGKRVATGSYFGEVKVWDAETGKEVASLTGMSTSNNPTMFSADGKRAVSPRWESPAVWSLPDGKLMQEFKGHKSWCRTARFDATASRIVTAGLDKTARVWDVKTGKVLFTLDHPGEVGFAAFSPDAKRVLTLSAGKVRVWELPAEGK